MTVTPVLARELRTAGRQPFTYTLRLLGVGALLAIMSFYGATEGFTPGFGGRLFQWLHTALFCAIWILVPILTADSISRERREGTMVLLALTPLTPNDVVIAKTFADGLRAFSLWLVVLPVLVVPLLGGGVGWVDIVASVVINLVSLMLAMASGLLASSLSKVFSRALVGAVCLAFLNLVFLLWLFGFAHELGTVRAMGLFGYYDDTPSIWSGLRLALNADDSWKILASARPGPTQMLWSDQTFVLLLLLGAFVIAAFWKFKTRRSTGAKLLWGTIVIVLFVPIAGLISGDFWTLMGPRATVVHLLWVLAIVLLFALGAILFQIRLVGSIVRKSWRGETRPKVVDWLDAKLCRPLFFTGLLRTWMRRELRRNPISWLEQRTWSGRLVIWSWLAVVMSVHGYLLANFSLFMRGFEATQVFLAWLLAGSMAASAASSFRRERDSGLLELLLVAPLREWQLIGGRLRGLLMRFLPAIALLFAVWIYVGTFEITPRLEPILFCIVLFVCIPVIGLYFSLAVNGFIGALIRTLLLGLILPTMLAQFSGLELAALVLPILSAAWCGWRLYNRLKRRAFAFQA